MYDVLRVRVLERLGDVAGDGEGAIEGELALALDEGAERLALDVGHGVVEEVVAGLAGAEHGHDAGMMQAHRDLDLALEAVDVDAGGEVGGEDFDDHTSPDGGIVGNKHLRHAAATKLTAQPIARAEAGLK